MNKKICIIGTDKRSEYLRKLYKEEGKKLYDMEDAKYIITSIPYSRDGIRLSNEVIECSKIIETFKNSDKVLISGAYLEKIKEELNKNNIKFYDILEFEEVAIKNAMATAEGAIFEAIQKTNITLCNSNVLVIGYGRIGKILTKMLNGIGANVISSARNKKDIALIKSLGYNSINTADVIDIVDNVDIIFNTVPSNVITNDVLDKISMNNIDCYIIDLASNPGGLDFKYAKDLNINVTWALSLPSKIAPKSAAMFLKEKIDDIVNI